MPANSGHRSSSFLRIGYLGRIAADKNVEDAIAIAAKINEARPVELHLAGPFEPPSMAVGSPAALARAARRARLPGDSVVYHGNLPHSRVWNFLGGIDVLVFPAVSTNETFGRVIVEAGRAGVPVVATDFAAAPELLPSENRVPVHYHPVKRARLSTAFSLGSPDIESAAATVLAGPRAVDVLDDARYASSTFIRMLEGNEPAMPAPTELSREVRSYLDRIQLDGIPELGLQESAGLCRRQLALMRELSHGKVLPRVKAVIRMSGSMRGDAMVRRVARESLSGELVRGALRNVVAHARFLGFDPRLTLT